MKRQKYGKFDRLQYQKDCIYNFQCNFVKGRDDDIIEYIANLKGSKIEFMRKVFREHILNKDK